MEQNGATRSESIPSSSRGQLNSYNEQRRWVAGTRTTVVGYVVTGGAELYSIHVDLPVQNFARNRSARRPSFRHRAQDVLKINKIRRDSQDQRYQRHRQRNQPNHSPTYGLGILISQNVSKTISLLGQRFISLLIMVVFVSDHLDHRGQCRQCLPGIVIF